jgi:protein-S-isoprenylcysteine O-methyltransferase Ste14
VLFGWLALGLRVFDSRLGVILPSWVVSAGIILMVLGGMLVLFCITTFVFIGKGTPAVFDPPREFVAVGPYAYVRNPMYIGGFILIIGFGLYHTSVSMLIFCVVLAVIFHFFVLFVEEPILERKFGESYLAYKRNVHRWFPKSKRYQRGF